MLILKCIGSGRFRRFTDANVATKSCVSNSGLDQDPWQIIVDNHFASDLLASSRYSQLQLLQPPSIGSDICDFHRALDFHDPSLRVQDSLTNLEQRQQACKLCRVLLHPRTRMFENGNDEFTLERIGSNIHLAGQSFPPVLSMFGNESRFSDVLVKRIAVLMTMHS